jgi:hypothetical protein
MGWQLTCEIGERLHGARAVAPVHCQQASDTGSGARGQEGHWCLGGSDLGRVVEEEAHRSGVLHGGAARPKADGGARPDERPSMPACWSERGVGWWLGL